jgi:hypothetical protein
MSETLVRQSGNMAIDELWNTEWNPYFIIRRGEFYEEPEEGRGGVVVRSGNKLLAGVERQGSPCPLKERLPYLDGG